MLGGVGSWQRLCVGWGGWWECGGVWVGGVGVCGCVCARQCMRGAIVSVPRPRLLVNETK